MYGVGGKDKKTNTEGKRRIKRRKMSGNEQVSVQPVAVTKSENSVLSFLKGTPCFNLKKVNEA